MELGHGSDTLFLAVAQTGAAWIVAGSPERLQSILDANRIGHTLETAEQSRNGILAKVGSVRARGKLAVDKTWFEIRMFRSAIIPRGAGRYRPSGRQQIVAEAVDAHADDEIGPRS